MNLIELLSQARSIWGNDRLTLPQIITRLGVDFGKLCRWERDADKDRASHTDEELKQEMGNIIFSMIRWCDDLGYAPEECVALAVDCQKKFAAENRHR